MNRFRHRVCTSRPLIYSLCVLAGLGLSGCGGVLDATIGGTVYGLSGGTSVVLVDNGTDPITVGSNGSFTFDQTITAQDTYDVTVQTQPIGETCTVTNGTGTVTQNGGDVTNVNVTCNATTTSGNYVFGSVAGLASGQSVVLQDNGTESLTVSSNGPFVFKTALAVGATYSVIVQTNPSGQTCTVADATGTIPSTGSNATVTVTCQ